MAEDLERDLHHEARERAAELHAALRARGLTLATAESLTGGGLAELVSAVPGASASYRGGMVAYASDVKVSVLGVSERTVAEHGVVSAQCAAEMAEGVRGLLGADVAVSTTGVAGPDAQEDKPVGLVFLGIADGEQTRTFELRLDGDRAEIRRQSARRAVIAVLEVVVGRPV
ncbi:CinA family protein [Nocardioides mesophilus]|uniref:CinA family protein n=1 Tax=Nocardioides mesophilus TaxID=433659 RepID=A0A7G9R9H0_9ACTN|nr:CinA family protein [Nocardioides mesophilus]QNN52245.1 CinA family protein [Nocardioides mesophilus]